MFTPGFDASERRSALIPLTGEPAPEMVADWNNIGLFATGIALGTVLGAAVALLVAPASGRELRERVGRRFGRGGESGSVWDELADELARAEIELAKDEEKAAGD